MERGPNGGGRPGSEPIDSSRSAGRGPDRKPGRTRSSRVPVSLGRSRVTPSRSTTSGGVTHSGRGSLSSRRSPVSGRMAATEVASPGYNSTSAILADGCVIVPAILPRDRFCIKSMLSHVESHHGPPSKGMRWECGNYQHTLREEAMMSINAFGLIVNTSSPECYASATNVQRSRPRLHDASPAPLKGAFRASGLGPALTPGFQGRATTTLP